MPMIAYMQNMEKRLQEKTYLFEILEAKYTELLEEHNKLKTDHVMIKVQQEIHKKQLEPITLKSDWIFNHN